MTVYNIKYHLQRWRLAFQGIISRDDGAIFKVSSPEMKACISRYHLQNRWSEMTMYIMMYHHQRWRLGKHGIISATIEFFLGQRWRRTITISSIISEMPEWFSRYNLQRWRLAFQSIISKIIGQWWLGYIYNEVLSPRMTAWKTRYHL